MVQELVDLNPGRENKTKKEAESAVIATKLRDASLQFTNFDVYLYSDLFSSMSSMSAIFDPSLTSSTTDETLADAAAAANGLAPVGLARRVALLRMRVPLLVLQAGTCIVIIPVVLPWDPLPPLAAFPARVLAALSIAVMALVSSRANHGP